MFAQYLEDMLCEMFLLSASGLVTAKLAPIWYLSAMFLVLPLFCCLLYGSRTHAFMIYIFSWLLPVLYYGKVGVISERAWPHDLLRAFVCLSLGAFVFLVSEKLKQIDMAKRQRYILTAAETGGLILTVIMTFLDFRNGKMILLLLIGGLAVLLSGTSYTCCIKDKYTGFLGQMSLFIYLFHWPVLKFISYRFSGWGLKDKVTVFYLGTFIISFLVYVSDKWTKKLLRR